jgi:hypothetical protein
MKLLSSTVLLGVASAAVQPGQQVLKNPIVSQIEDAVKPISEAWSMSSNPFAESMAQMSADAKAVWEEVNMHFPSFKDKDFFFSSPKPNTRKSDSTWDYVVKGAELQSVWVENASGQKQRKVDGRLEQYNLRAKKVDPAKLGVDTVKQYSGYLDDEEEDKASLSPHLTRVVQPNHFVASLLLVLRVKKRPQERSRSSLVERRTRLLLPHGIVPGAWSFLYRQEVEVTQQPILVERQCFGYLPRSAR